MGAAKSAQQKVAQRKSQSQGHFEIKVLNLNPKNLWDLQKHTPLKNLENPRKKFVKKSKPLKFRFSRICL